MHLIARLGSLIAPLLVSGIALADGAEITLASPPAGAQGWPRACSLRHPVCVHVQPGASARVVLQALDAIDRAWDVETQTLELPAPDGGGDGIWDAYIVDGVAEGGRAQLTSRGPLARSDRGASLGLLDGRAAAGCALDVATARALAWGALLRMAPAMDSGTARAQTRMLARLATGCSDGTEDDRSFQAEPETTLVDPESLARSSGASMFFDWLETRFAGEPGALVAGTWALAPTKTPPGAWRWGGKPTYFDVLASSLAGAMGTDSDLDDVLLRFAVDRALAPPPARVAWHIPWPDHARRLASPVPVAPTGASYVMVDHAGAPSGATLRVE